MTTVAAGWARFPRPTSATSSRSSDPKAKAWWVRRPYRWMDGAAFLCGYGAGARFSAGARLDQRRTAPARRRSAGTARNHRLLDVLLNQLHAHLSAVAEDRAQVWRPGGRGRCPLPQVPGRTRDGEPPGGGLALPHRAPDRQRPRLCGVEPGWAAGPRAAPMGRAHRPRSGSPAASVPVPPASISGTRTTTASRLPIGRPERSVP